MDDFDELQRRMVEDALKSYSRTVVGHFMEPRNHGPMEDADGEGVFNGPCGDTVWMWVKVRDGVVLGASFTTDGCGTSVASGSMATVLAEGRTVEQARSMDSVELLEALDGLPPEKEHCAVLAVTALKKALKGL